MNIYALKGFKVIVTENSINSGWESYSELANIHLKVGNTYTIESTLVNNSYTSVRLQEIKTLSFSSMSFIDIDVQSTEDDETHPDWVNLDTDEGYEKYLKEN